MNDYMNNIEQIQADLIEEFQLFDSWLDRYQYIIDLGKQLPEFPDEFRTDHYKLHGCQSQVWLKGTLNTDRLDFQADSDSTIVSGLIALVLRVYSGQRAEDILNTPPDFIRAIGLSEHLSPTRNNGLASMITTIREQAGSCSGS
jgi:cysteine desulfuration protein SufE